MRRTKIDADVLTGWVTFAEGLRVEITVGRLASPEAKLYLDGNPLGLKKRDAVLVAVTRRREDPADQTEQAK